MKKENTSNTWNPSADRPGYKHTPLGWIPEDWFWCSLGEISSVGSGTTPSKSNVDYWENGNIPWLPTGKVNERVIIHADEFITEFAKEQLSIKLLPINTIVLAMIGQGKTRGKVAILKLGAWINQNFAYLIPTKQTSSEYLFHSLEYNYYRIRYEGNRGGNQGSLNTGMVRNILVLYPPLPEQIAIANLLTTWDSAIAKLQDLIAAKHQRKKWLMQQLLTGKKRLPGFEGEWEKVTYGDLLTVVKRYVDWNNDDLYHLISVRRRSGGIFERESLYGHQIKVKDLRTARAGDFLFSKMQIVHGASALVTPEFDGTKISGSYIAVVASQSSKLDMNFFNWHSRMPYFYHQTYVSSYGVHIEKMTFDFESFLSLGMHLPSVDEQSAIVSILNAAESELNILNQELETLMQQKRGLMQQLLTGKKRLNA